MLVYGLFVDVLQRECIISWRDMEWKMRAVVCTRIYLGVCVLMSTCVEGVF